MKKPLLLSAAVGLALSTVAIDDALAGPKWAKKGDTIVKCRGIAKKGKNDCGANGHSCANNAKTDMDDNEWVYVPEGVCEKIVGGVVWKKKTVK